MNPKNDRTIDKSKETPIMKTMKLTAGLSFAVTCVLLSASAVFGQETNGPTPVQLQPFAIITGGPDTSVPLDDPQPVHSSVIIAGGTPQTAIVPNAVTPTATLVRVSAPTIPDAIPSLQTASVIPQTTPAFVNVPTTPASVSVPTQPQNRPIIVRPGPPKYLPHH
jgi:hypothetical protein